MQSDEGAALEKQVCSREPGHDGPHALEVVVEFVAWGGDGIVTRSYVVEDGVASNAESRADTR